MLFLTFLKNADETEKTLRMVFSITFTSTNCYMRL